jgi:hypothetical protein
MVEKRFCDLCLKEIKEFDRTYFLSYGEKGKIPFMSKGKKGEICEVCFRKVYEFIDKLKRTR